MQTTLKKTLSALAVSAAMSAACGAAFAADSLTITSWGGAYSKSQDEAYYKPYAAKTGAKITQEEYNGEAARIRAMVESGNTTWDLVDVDSATAQQGCDEGFLTPIDYARFGGKDKFVKGSTSDCGVPTIIYSTIYAYDGDKIKDGPTTIAGLFDTAKWPGKRALQKTPFGNLEFALLADGVPVDKVYEVLKTKEGVDRAFKKLDTIKKDIVWWEAGAQPPQLLAAGEVAFATAWNGRIFGANKDDKKNFKIVWDGQLLDWDLWSIPKGVKDIEAAYKFLEFASSPEPQADQTKYISYGPALLAAVPHVDPTILKDLPTAPENVKNALANDVVFWGDNKEELLKRFNTWIAQ